MTGTPVFSHLKNVMWWPARSARVAVTMLAEAPISVALPAGPQSGIGGYEALPMGRQRGLFTAMHS